MAGELKSDRYQVEREIGRGGMGRVFRAVDTQLGRCVALKMLPAELSRDPEILRRLSVEARAAAALNHPGVATVYDFVERAAESFIVYEYVDGATLRERISQRRFTTAEILSVGIQLADALAAAHEHAIVHRDIKPENIMLAPGPEPPGRVRVLDFGVAKVRRPLTATAGASGAETATVSTAAGLLVGTVNYMAPEQLEGEPADARSDLYGLGLVLYEMATGQHPFLGRTATSTIANILKREPAPITERNPVAPPELDRILRKCLRKRPEERYQSARELFADLTNLRRDLAPGGDRSADAHAPVLLPFFIARSVARALLVAIQIGYLAMYAAALYQFSDVQRVSKELYSTDVLGALLSTVAFLGVPLRLYTPDGLEFRLRGLGSAIPLAVSAIASAGCSVGRRPAPFPRPTARAAAFVFRRARLPAFVSAHADVFRLCADRRTHFRHPGVACLLKR